MGFKSYSKTLTDIRAGLGYFMVHVDSLEAKFRLLWGKLGAKGDSEDVFQEIVKRYTEPQRSYQT